MDEGQVPPRKRLGFMANGITLGKSKYRGLLRICADAAITALTGQRVRPVWLLAGTGWLLFACFRIGLLIVSWDVLSGVVPSEVFWCLLTGLRYDAVPIGLAMLPLAMLLSLVPGYTFGRKWFRRTVMGYAVGVTTVAIFGEVVGVAFFLHFGSRLNWLSMAYFGHFRELAIYIWNTYPIWLLGIGTITVPCLLYAGCKRVFWRGRQPNGPLWVRPIQAVMLGGLCILAGRGGLDHHPLRSGSAYFSANNVINQITLNNFFTIGHAALLQLDDNLDEDDSFPLPSTNDAAPVAARMFLQPGDTPLGVEDNPLWRRTDTGVTLQDYNVVLILMEGMAGTPVGAMGYNPSHTPNLDRISREGLFFQRMYAVGPRTARGVTGTLCGYPDLGGQSIIKRQLSQGAFLTLPRIFRQRGYRTLFIYGGNPEFDNMHGFFKAGGVETFISEEQMRTDRQPGNWGMPDEVIFRHANKTFQDMTRRGEKFFAAILTVSNHQPFDIPLDRTEMLPHDTDQNKRLNAYRYADWALGEYFRIAAGTEYFKRTIFILVSDHGREFDRKRLIDVPGYRVPCIFYAPGILPSLKVSVTGSQTDIAPTLLAMLGGSFEHCFFGRNLLTVQPGEGFALLHEADRLAIVRGDQALILPPRQKPRLFHTDTLHLQELPHTKANEAQIEEMQRQMLSYYQTARSVYLKKSYQRIGAP